MSKLSAPILNIKLPAAIYDNINFTYKNNSLINKDMIKTNEIYIEGKRKTVYCYKIKLTNPITLQSEEIDGNSEDFQTVNTIYSVSTETFYKIQLAYIDKNNIIGEYSNVGIIKLLPHFNIANKNTLINNESEDELQEYIYSFNYGIKKNNIILYEFPTYYLKDINDNNINYNILTDVKNNNTYLNNLNFLKKNNNTVLYVQYITNNGYKGIQEINDYSVNYENNTLNCENNNVLEKDYLDLYSTTEDNQINKIILNEENFLLYYSIDKSNQIIQYIPIDLSTEYVTTKYYYYNSNNHTYNLINDIQAPDYWGEVICYEAKYHYLDYCVNYGINEYLIDNQNSSDINDDIINFECYFDYISLFDNNHFLNIKFNPKISSFKTTILESKVDTIGGKYPIFYRNGNTQYKEFPISGLISYEMDEDNNFLSGITYFKSYNEDILYNAPNRHNINNIRNRQYYYEYVFRTEVYKWLTNGKNKIFRSPTEGNIIVRLMNVSLSPEEKLGRMIYTFSATAYEIAEYNYNNFKDLQYKPIYDGTIIQPKRLRTNYNSQEDE